MIQKAATTVMLFALCSLLCSLVGMAGYSFYSWIDKEPTPQDICRDWAFEENNYCRSNARDEFCGTDETAAMARCHTTHNVEMLMKQCMATYGEEQ